MACQANAPEFRVASERYSQEDLVILSLSVGEDPDVVRAFVDRLELDFPYAVDTNGAVAAFYGLITTPTTFVISQDGRIIETREGVIDQAWIDAAVEQGGG